ncbi:MAG: porin [Alphaproteobacteria bacterium]|nr:porin [Alphaproteobacteria bacterium]
MKKLLLSSVAVIGLATVATPAAAQVQLDLGGYFKGYGAYVDQDEAAASEVNNFDIIRNTEVHFGGETTLDNGLTVGAHIEAAADGGDAFGVDESYVYLSGGWGRVNFGDEDGAAYLLQVEAPSADANIDGLRQYVQPVNYTVLPGVAAGTISSSIGSGFNQGGIDYDQDVSGKASKLTYLTPILNGFQAGVSYSPDTDNATELGGVGSDDVVNAFGETYEAGVRYEGQFNNIGMVLGAGYSHTELEAERAAGAFIAGDFTDDRQAWNVGADFDFGPFGLGVAYMEDNFGEASTAGVGTPNTDDEETIVVGADYTTGPFKLGASYLNKENTNGVDGLDTDRYSGGVTYTYGPGMTFRGSVGHIEHDPVGAGDADATYVVLGTQINF